MMFPSPYIIYTAHGNGTKLNPPLETPNYHFRSDILGLSLEINRQNIAHFLRRLKFPKK